MQSQNSQHLADDRMHRMREHADRARLAAQVRPVGASRRAFGLALVRLGLRIAGAAAARPARAEG